MKMTDARKQWLKLLRVGQKNCLILFWEGIFDQKHADWFHDLLNPLNSIFFL